MGISFLLLFMHSVVGELMSRAFLELESTNLS